MAYTHLPDEFTELSWDLSDSAFRLHVAALGYSNRLGTDGLVSKSALVRLGPKSKPSVAYELMEAGWWEEQGASYRVLKTMEHQEAAETVRLRKAAARKRSQDFRRRRAETLNDEPTP